mmetsp:Transcript_10009/g.28415  ORF Transcript_10009/g.28415 Transcript_10009/m.28415 type:complete len:219 (+) Transcript_10009:141-797(+)
MRPMHEAIRFLGGQGCVSWHGWGQGVGVIIELTGGLGKRCRPLPRRLQRVLLLHELRNGCVAALPSLAVLRPSRGRGSRRRRSREALHEGVQRPRRQHQRHFQTRCKVLRDDCRFVAQGQGGGKQQNRKRGGVGLGGVICRFFLGCDTVRVESSLVVSGGPSPRRGGRGRVQVPAERAGRGFLRSASCCSEESNWKRERTRGGQLVQPGRVRLPGWHV